MLRPEATGGEEPRFVSGSTLRHVAVMTATGSVGLVAIVLVDLLSLLYVSWLGEPHLTAAVGLATVLLFLATSINVGLMIAVAALVSRALGARDRGAARRLAGSSLAIMTAVAALVAAVLVPLAGPILDLMGATGESAAAARRFVAIVMPSNVLMALGMGFSGVLRAVGDARRAMYVTLVGAVVTAALDPLLIFGLGLGIDGAAIALILSRVLFAVTGFNGAVRVHDLVARPRLADLRRDAAPMIAIALPAVLTNVATPVAGAFLAGVMTRFGDAVVAGNAVIDRLVPVAFGGLFALSGAVGPILGQNWGAGRFDRMRRVLRDSLLFTGLYVAAAWALLVLMRADVVALFGASGRGADLVLFFCLVGGIIWFFNGLLFVANASFNNLGFPVLATAFNWGRATLGTVPLALLGAAYAGPEGAIAGFGAGSVLFGVAAIAVAFRTIGVLERRAAGSRTGAERPSSRPHSTSRPDG